MLVPLALARCAGTASITPASILTGVQAVITGLSGALATVQAAAPTAIPVATITTVQTDLGSAAQVAQGLVAGLPATTGASLVQQVEGFFNDILTICAEPPLSALIPAPFSTALAAAAIALPTLEAFVSQYVTSASAPLSTLQARAKLVAAVPQIVSYDQAVAVLQSFAKK
jgi:hypothetical protein